MSNAFKEIDERIKQLTKTYAMITSIIINEAEVGLIAFQRIKMKMRIQHLEFKMSSEPLLLIKGM